MIKAYLALSVVAPAGDRIAAGGKRLEVRKWRPDRLPLRDLLIVQNRISLSSAGPTEDPDGVAVALVDVVRVREWQENDQDAAGAERWEPGWQAWELAKVRPLTGLVKAAARLRLYELRLDLAR